MRRELTLEELAERTGEPAARLAEWRARGLIGREGAVALDVEDVERARLVQLFVRRGIGLDVIARSMHEGFLRRRLRQYLDALLGGPVHSREEAAAAAGLPPDVCRRLWDATCLGKGGDVLTATDVGMLTACRGAMEAGFPVEAIEQLLRTWASALERAAEASGRLFHFYVHDPLREAGVSGHQAEDVTSAALERLEPLVEPAVLYFYARGNLRAQPEDMVMHLADESGVLAKRGVAGQVEAAVLFVDLSSFTPLAEAMGDVRAAEVLERFAALVREATGRWQGRVIKQIGDAFMLVFAEAPSAVACALDIEDRTSREPQFPAVRSGVHWGPMLYREGDYVGSSVNLAWRVASEAPRHGVLVTSAVRTEAGGLDGVEFVHTARRRLKGVAGECDLFEARRSGVVRSAKVIDPVCGMELGPAEIAARLTLGERERAFCSDACLRRFVASPERYGE